MAAAAIAAPLAVKQVGEAASSAFKAAMDFAAKPVYSNLTTTTTTRTTKDGTIVVTTHSKGWTIPAGLIIGIAALVAIWEAMLSLSKAIAGGLGGSDAAAAVLLSGDILAAPITVAVDEASNVVGVLTSQGFWDWLDGRGAKNSTAPPTASKQVALPQTGMAALSELMRNTLGTATAVSGTFIPKLLAALGT